MPHALIKTLRQVPGLAGLDDATLIDLAADSMNLVWDKGSVVFAEGDLSGGLFVVLKGRVEVLDNGDEARALAEIGPGEVLGEIATLMHTPHSRTARALEFSELLFIPSDALEELLSSSPELATNLRADIEERLASGSPG